MRKELEIFYTSLPFSEQKLMKISEDASCRKPAENKWSAKEIIGHLIDSSINNSVRFISGQYNDKLVFNGYEQNKWVDIQNYQIT